MTMKRYPSEEELEKIEKWSHDDFKGLMEYVQDRWNWGDTDMWTYEDGIYRISTGGWSGNEDLISALQGNFVIWSIHWWSHRTGGHYVFVDRGVEPANLPC